MALNIEELKKLREKVRNTMEPGSKDRFDMNIWGERRNDCGTVACLAGFTRPNLFLDMFDYATKYGYDTRGYELMQERAVKEAAYALGLDGDELFHDTRWPEEFYDEYGNSTAESAIRLLDWMIENEREPEWR